MAFREDGRHAVLYGDPVGGRLDIYLTSDGGETWKPLPERQRPKLEEGEYGFAASGSGIVAKGQKNLDRNRRIRCQSLALSRRWRDVESPCGHDSLRQ